MNPRVLVVDDDAENCRVLSELLAAEGFDSLPYESGEAAWQALKTREVQPDIVVADMRMPGLDGIALLRRIKADFAAIPVVLVSAFADEAVWAEGLRAGAIDVFPKPIQGTSLVRVLRKVMEMCRTQGSAVGETPDPRSAGIIQLWREP